MLGNAVIIEFMAKQSASFGHPTEVLAQDLLGRRREDLTIIKGWVGEMRGGKILGSLQQNNVLLLFEVGCLPFVIPFHTYSDLHQYILFIC